MNKQEFLKRLQQGLSWLPENDAEERLTFYGEMIDDRMEDGLTEEEAVRAVGEPEDLIAQILAETPLRKLVKEKITPKRKIKAWKIVLLVLGSPIWLSLGVAALAVILALYVSVWAVIVSLWSVFASVAAGILGGVVGGVVFACGGNALTGVAILGAGLFCAGLGIFLFFGCMAATKGVLILTKRSVLWMKNGLIKGGKAE